MVVLSPTPTLSSALIAVNVVGNVNFEVARFAVES